MRIAVVGAGGLGAYLGAVLARAGHELHLVARGEHRRRMMEEGVTVRDPSGETHTVRVSCPADAGHLEGVQVAFVTVKTWALEEVAPQLRHLALRGSRIVPLLNGVDAPDRLREAGVPWERIVPGVAYLTAFRTAPGVVERQGGHGRLILRDGPTVQDLADALSSSGIEVELSERIEEELWRKMVLVSAMSAICGLTRSSLGPIRAHPFGAVLQAVAVSEAVTVARARGVPLPEEEERRTGDRLDAFPESFHPSLLHDLRVGNRTEVASLSGEISRLGRLHGIPTPLHDAATCAIQLQEGITPPGSGSSPGPP